MTIQATCDGCFRTYNVKDQLAGRRIKCPDCGATVQIPDPRQSAQPAADAFGGGDFGDDDFSDDFAAPERPSRGGKRKSSAHRKGSGGSSLPAAVVLGGVAVVAILVCCGGIGFFAFLGEGGTIEAAERDQQLDQALALRQVGETREESGSLGMFDDKLESGEFCDEYAFTAGQGDVFVIDLYSDELDSYLIVRDETGFQLDNDDAGMGEDPGHAQIVFSTPHGGTFYAVPTSYEPGETGSYLLTIRTVTGGGTGGPVREESGSLASGDDQLVESDDEYRDMFTLSAEVGDLFVIDLNSTQFDTYLFLEGPEGSQVLIENDDYGDATHSQMTLLAPQAGDYNISVTSYEGGETGSYRLTIREL